MSKSAYRFTVKLGKGWSIVSIDLRAELSFFLSNVFCQTLGSAISLPGFLPIIVKPIFSVYPSLGSTIFAPCCFAYSSKVLGYL